MNMKNACQVFLSICSCFLMSHSLTGQDTVSAFGLSDVSELAIAQKGCVLIVIFESDRDGAIKAMRSMLSDPAVLPYRVNMAVEASNSRHAADLKLQKIWEGRQSGWAFMGPDGKLAGAKDGLPSVEDLKTMLASINPPTILAGLQTFYRQNSNRTDILTLVLGEFVRLGEGRLLHSYGGQPQSQGFALPDELDSDLWGEYSRLFRTKIDDIVRATSHSPIFTVVELNLFGSTFTSRILPSASAISSSAILKEMAHLTLRQIEQALIDSPYNTELWRLWGLLRPNNGGMQIDPFVDAVLQNRFKDPKRVPTLTIIGVLQQEEKWRQLSELLAPVWEGVLEESLLDDAKNKPQGVAMVGGVPIGDTTNLSKNRLLTSDQWGWHIFPLFQAYVKSGFLSKAEELMRAWVRENGWGGAVESARNCVLEITGQLPGPNWPN